MRAKIFYDEEAMRYGLNESILLNYLRLFLRGNQQRGNNIDDDGVVWTYTTYEQIAAEHPFWSVDKVGRMVRALRASGVIRAERRGYDGMTHFSFVDKSMMQNTSDMTARVQPHDCKNVDSTIYAEVILKNTEEGDHVISPEMVREYFYGKGYSDSDAVFLSDGFVSHDHKKYPLTASNWRRKASEWANRAVKFDGIKKPAGPFTDEQIRDPQTGNINTAVYRKRNTGWFK